MMSGGQAGSGGQAFLTQGIIQGGNYSASALQEAYQSIRGQKRGDAGTQWGPGPQQLSKARGADPRISFLTQKLGVGPREGWDQQGRGSSNNPGVLLRRVNNKTRGARQGQRQQQGQGGTPVLVTEASREVREEVKGKVKEEEAIAAKAAAKAIKSKDSLAQAMLSSA